ncbi:wax ester/triacylglycerol synthase family O-acyltransferase [Nonomuraea monospora]|uniref:diacylglycerol O-acyltransferase n=1 Tax=Nonomuraea monospora TaxID=568818 RepID=A0ABN3CHR7_9ACTN
MIERLSTGDLMMIWAEKPGSPMNMNLGMAGVVDQDGPLDVERLRALVSARLHRGPMLRRRVHRTRFWQGPPLWVDDQRFDLARHIELVRLPPGADFLDWAATRIAEPLDLGHAPWRLLCVTGVNAGTGLDAGPGVNAGPGLDAGTSLDAGAGSNAGASLDGGTGLVVALHHTLADGKTAVALADVLLSAVSQESGQENVPWKAARPPSASSLVRDAAAAKAAALWRALKGIPHLPAKLRVLATAFRAVGPRVPSLPFPVVRDGGRRLATAAWPLADVERAAHTLDATVNDIALTLTTFGVRRLLTASGEPVAGHTLRVSVPVAAAPGMRNAGGSAPLMISLPLDEPDPLRALAQVTARTRAAKASRADTPSWQPPRLVMRLMMSWVRRHGAERVNLYVTNVPGPAAPLWLDGARLTAVYPIAPITAGVPLAVAVLSYAGTLVMTVTAAPELTCLPAFAAGAREAMTTLAGVREAVTALAGCPASAPRRGGASEGRRP